MMAGRGISCRRWAGQVIVSATILFLSIAGGALGGNNVGFAGAAFCASDQQGPSFDLSWMPDFGDLIPTPEPVNLTLRLVVEVTDPDGVDSVIGSYRNSSQPAWTNVTMSEDLLVSDPDVYAADALNYTTPAGGFLIIWQAIFYANDSLGNWNKSEMKNMSVSRQIGSMGFNDAIVYGVVATLGLGILVAAVCHDRKKK